MKLFSFILIISINLYYVLCQDWDYTEKGPDTWFINFATCKSTAQSPINIKTSSVVTDPQLKPFTFTNYDQDVVWTAESGSNKNLKFTPAAGAGLAITGSNFKGKVYNLLQFHFHWGYNDYQGSEHELDENKFPLEVHFVHQAADNQLTVLGFLFQITAFDNVNLDPLITAAVSIIGGTPATVTINLKNIIPPVTGLVSYYRYSGSLTNPPCSENVIWNVFPSKISISAAQAARIRTAFKNGPGLVSTFRPTQKLNGRVVYLSDGLMLKSNLFICFITFVNFIVLSF